MFTMLGVALVAGLLIESSQQVRRPCTKPTVKPTVSPIVVPTIKSTLKPIVKPTLKPIGPGDYPTHIQCWTDWFDKDDPSATGDWETLSDLRKENPGKICPRPTRIQAMTLSGLSPAATGDSIFQYNPSYGFVCRNKDQIPPKRMCNDYRVRFSCHPPFCGGGVCWTKWYDRDDPSVTGDWELLTHLRNENPGEICRLPLYIEAVTTNTNTPAISTGEVFFMYNPTQGFVCRKKDQKDGTCLDYKVRFGCPCMKY